MVFSSGYSSSGYSLNECVWVKDAAHLAWLNECVWVKDVAHLAWEVGGSAKA